MKYKSTRDYSKNPAYTTSADAIKRGLAPDGGLYMPESLPKLTDKDIDKLSEMKYYERAAYILSLFLDDYNYDTLLSDCKEAYSEERFPGKDKNISDPAPLVSLGENIFSLELWHGPTCAFKDMALQIMPRLLSRALEMSEEKRTAHILVATSGDTGKAALEGYKDVNGIKITVFYPVDGVSPMQKRQMATQEGNNVDVCAVYGNFDDAQSGVKKIFADNELREKAASNGVFFSSANSINWGRLAPQIVYYVSAYCDLISMGEIKNGDSVNVCVPTGNFGNIFAAYIAKRMGLPIDKLICASNSNCVLTDFIRTGEYNRLRSFCKTMSPSMDILISSNLERLIYTLGGAEITAALMNELSVNGKYTVPENLFNMVQDNFKGYFCSEEETADIIHQTFDKRGYLADPHTAVGIGSAEKYMKETGDSKKIILASTASPYKFPADVLKSLGVSFESDDPSAHIAMLEKYTSTSAPNALVRALSLPVRFTKTINPAEMSEVIF